MKDIDLDEGMLAGFDAGQHGVNADCEEPEATVLEANEWFLPAEPMTSKAIASGLMEEIHEGSNYPKNPQTWLLLVLNALQSHYSSIQLSTLDMTCAFSVSDLRKPDMPLIYCSPTFEQLTKYTLQEVEGRNHRFMQNPTGDQRAGEFRKHTDHASVIRMMQDLSIGNETQVTLSNYVKSSERWTNLLTMIPIVLNPHGIVDFYVGLQLNIDLFPENILKLPNGSFEIDYKVKPQIERPLSMAFDSGSGISTDTHLSGQGLATPEYASKLSNEIVDTMLIISMLGKVLQVSPSVNSLVGYEPEYLVGSYLSSILHPSDLAQVLQKFDAVSEQGSLDFVARLRHHDGTYLWINFVGQVLSASQTDKLIVLSGRKTCISHHGGTSDPVREGEIWTRISPDGMILFISSSATSLLGMPLSQLPGKHFKDFIPEQDHAAFLEACSAAVMGVSSTIQHHCIQKDPVYGALITCVSNIIPASDKTKIQISLLVRTLPLVPEGHRQQQYEEPISPTVTTAQAAFKKAYSISLQPSSSFQILSSLSPERPTAWQMEMQQAKLINQRLRAALQAARKHAAETRDASVASSTITTGPAHQSAPRMLQCSACHARETTQWRTGPQGARLCNSCGLSWRKRSR